MLMWFGGRDVRPKMLLPQGRNVRVAVPLLISVYQAGERITVRKVGISDVKRDAVILIERVPDIVRECVDVARYVHALGLALKGRERVAVGHIGVNKMSESALCGV